MVIFLFLERSDIIKKFLLIILALVCVFTFPTQKIFASEVIDTDTSIEDTKEDTKDAISDSKTEDGLVSKEDQVSTDLEEKEAVSETSPSDNEEVEDALDESADNLEESEEIDSKDETTSQEDISKNDEALVEEEDSEKDVISEEDMTEKTESSKEDKDPEVSELSEEKLSEEDELEIGEEVIGNKLKAKSPMELFENLKNLIFKSNDGDEISLEEGEYNFTEAIQIDKKIKLKNNGQVTFKRDGNYKGIFFNILKNGSLDLSSDDDKFSIDGGEKVSQKTNGAGMILVEGELILNGVNIENDKNSNSGINYAPIKAIGDKARIILNSGHIRNNDYSGSGSAYAAGAIFLGDGAEMIMNGGEISGNQASNYLYNNEILWSASPGAGAIYVDHGAKFTMNGGTIKGNKGYGGGVLIGSGDPYIYKHDVTDHNKLDSPNLAEATFNGGKIVGNHGVGGGGISAMGNVNVLIPKTSTLLVDSNKAYQGGGIFVTDWYVNGDVKGKVSLEDWNKHFAGKFLMEAGTVSNNSVLKCGGGINVSTSNAKITGGSILNNKAVEHGGGIYLTVTPYVLHLENGYITDNHAIDVYPIISDGVILYDGSGGGIWFCPTGSAEFYSEDGAVIFGNDATREGADFWSADKNKNDYSVTLASRLPNGVRVKYYVDEEGNRYKAGESVRLGDIIDHKGSLKLKAVIDDGEIPEKSGLIIMGNIAARGGGIGTNGTVIFGKKPTSDNPLKDIEIEKNLGWNRS